MRCEAHDRLRDRRSAFWIEGPPRVGYRQFDVATRQSFHSEVHLNRKVAVLSSDAVNRNNIMVPAKELMRSLRSLHMSGLPNLVAHDAHRPIGWTYPRAFYVRPGASLLMGDIYMPESADEHERLMSHYQQHVAERHTRECETDQVSLRELVGDRAPGARLLYVGTTALEAPGLARTVVPEAFADEDGDGLVPLRELDTIVPGVYRFNKLAVFAHPFFRRSLSRFNSTNADLLGELDRLRGLAAIGNLRIRLDPDLVGLAESVKPHLEFVYWYGPKFSDDLSSIPLGVSRYDATDDQRLFYGLSRTEFWWHAQNGLRTLEAEEIRDSETFAAGSTPEYGCRYVHSIVNEDGTVGHLDGAIRGYDADGMLARLDQPITTAGRRSQYTKLWRVDGRLAHSNWKTLIHHHFRENPLVAEYFGAEGVPKADFAPSHGVAAASVTDLVPYMLDQADPLRLLVTVRASPEGRPNGRVVVSTQTLDGDPVVPADVADVRKLLALRGESLAFHPPNPLRLSASDGYFEFPLIMHDESASLSATRDVFIELLAGWARRDPARVVAVNLGLACGSSDIVLGSAGRIDAVLSWLQREEWFPHEGTDEAWIRAAKTSCVGNDRTSVAGIVLPAWILGFDRVRVPQDLIDCVEVVEGDLTVRLKLPRAYEAIAPALAAGTLVVRHVGVVREAKCSGCGAEYWSCPCVKTKDGVFQTITDMQLVGFYWSTP